MKVFFVQKVSFVLQCVVNVQVSYQAPPGAASAGKAITIPQGDEDGEFSVNANPEWKYSVKKRPSSVWTFVESKF